jgi:methionyl-tRNA formyltransferase
MNYVFFGTPQFAAIILEKLIKAGLLPQVVVCNPDKPVGRKKIITPPATKLLAQKYNIPILQPESLTDVKSQLSKVNCQFFVVAAYSEIIPKEILEIPRLGAIGVHPSFLPKYRGPSPIQTAILNGDEETGVSLFLMDEKVDHGPILATSHLLLANSDNYETLSKKLAELGAELLIKTLPDFVTGKITPLAQDESQATYTKKFKTEDAYIEPKDLEIAQQEGGDTAIEIDRKIRALNPEPGTWTLQNGKRMKILEAELISGKLRRPDGVGAPTYASALKLKKIQFEGKKPIFVK